MKFDFKQIPGSIIYFLILSAFILFGCNRKGSNEVSRPEYGDNSKLFTLLSPGKTGIDFANNVVDGEKFNIFTCRNYYNGAGVAIGDINNDSLPDIMENTSTPWTLVPKDPLLIILG